MDSANSASIQSSSGGDEEFDSSRGESSISISSFFNASPNFGSISAPNLNQQFLTRQNPNFFDDPIWSGGLNKPQFNFPNFGGINQASSSQQLSPFPIQSPSAAPRTDSDGHTSKPSDHHPNVSAVTKNPKKRTRASRRAPTTVLTTDTTNFRQMVQEFTGIPSSPFAGTSPYSRRLDLFSAPAALRLGGHLNSLGPLYSLRPQFPPSSSPPRPSLLNPTTIDSIVPSTNIINPNNPTAAALGGASTPRNSNNTYPDHVLTLENRTIPLQLGGNPFGGVNHDPSTVVADHNDNDDNLITRWKSGETVGNHDDDGVEENVVTTAFDGNIDRRNSSHHHHHQQQQHQNQISGHNRHLDVAEKGLGNAASSSSGTPGTIAPWIFPS